MPRSLISSRKSSLEPQPAPACSPQLTPWQPEMAGAGRKKGHSMLRHAAHHLPWRRSGDKTKLTDGRGDATGDTTMSTCKSASFHVPISGNDSCGAGGSGGAVSSRAPAEPGALKEADKVSALLSPSQGNLGDILREHANWRHNGERDVAALQAKIDDMWLDEVMLGCDTELFSRVRQAAADVEAGRMGPDAAVRIASEAAAETEAVGLDSVHSRLAARDFVRMAGGAEGLERRVRCRRGEAIQEVNQYLHLLAEPGRASEVRQAMDQMMHVAKEEYASVNAMKTAKSEVVIELQDKTAHSEWLHRQLSLAVTLLEATPLFCPHASPLEAEALFIDALQQMALEEPLRPRAMKCLEVLQQWGTAAARALAILNNTRKEEGEDTDSGTAAADQLQELPWQNILQLQPQPQQLPQEIAQVSARHCTDRAASPRSKQAAQTIMQLQPQPQLPQESENVSARLCTGRVASPCSEQPTQPQERQRQHRPRSSSPSSPFKLPVPSRCEPVTPLSQSPPRQPFPPPMSTKGHAGGQSPIQHELRGDPCWLERAEQSQPCLSKGEGLEAESLVDNVRIKVAPSHLSGNAAAEATNVVAPVPGG